MIPHRIPLSLPARTRCPVMAAMRNGTTILPPSSATETIKTVVAELKSINRSEWVAAHQVGYNPVVTAIVSAFDYNNEEIVEIDSERYVVYRTYSRKDDYIELMLRKKVGEADE